MARHFHLRTIIMGDATENTLTLTSGNRDKVTLHLDVGSVGYVGEKLQEMLAKNKRTLDGAFADLETRRNP